MKLLATLLIATSLSVSALWIKSDKGLYKILELEGAKIISVNTVTSGSLVTLTTITTNSGLYRCYEAVKMEFAQDINSCYVLRPD